MIFHMRQDQLFQFIGQFTCSDRPYTVMREYSICFYDRILREIRYLQGIVGNVDVADDTGQTKQCLDQKDPFFTRRYQRDLLFTLQQSFTAGKASLQIFFAP